MTLRWMVRRIRYRAIRTSQFGALTGRRALFARSRFGLIVTVSLKRRFTSPFKSTATAHVRRWTLLFRRKLRVVIRRRTRGRFVVRAIPVVMTVALLTRALSRRDRPFLSPSSTRSRSARTTPTRVCNTRHHRNQRCLTFTPESEACHYSTWVLSRCRQSTKRFVPTVSVTNLLQTRTTAHKRLPCTVVRQSNRCEPPMERHERPRTYWSSNTARQQRRTHKISKINV